MQRRQFHQTSLIGALLCATYQHAWALSLGDISNADAGRGVKAALAQGAQAAVALLGRQDGFLGNSKVRIGLPKRQRRTIREGLANFYWMCEGVPIGYD